MLLCFLNSFHPGICITPTMKLPEGRSNLRERAVDVLRTFLTHYTRDLSCAAYFQFEYLPAYLVDTLLAGFSHLPWADMSSG